jgi:hypothetical protein
MNTDAIFENFLPTLIRTNATTHSKNPKRHALSRVINQDIYTGN